VTEHAFEALARSADGPAPDVAGSHPDAASGGPAIEAAP